LCDLPILCSIATHSISLLLVIIFTDIITAYSL
jgi:hypothetical protein